MSPGKGEVDVRCARCEGELSERFRFCPWCAAPLRTKLVEHFRAHPLMEQDVVALRVSRYLTELRHIRFSIWNPDGAVAAISLEEREAARLASFVGLQSEKDSKARASEMLRASAQALLTELKTVARR
jgi:hypothetical protein